MKTRELARLTFLSRGESTSLLLLRISTGGFLLYGAIDNVLDPARMREFERFLAIHGFPAPAFAAPLSVYAQVICGCLLLLGVATRWAAWILVINFIVAIVMVDRLSPVGLRGVWPALALVVICAHLGCRGAGPISVDALLSGKRSKDSLGAVAQEPIDR